MTVTDDRPLVAPAYVNVPDRAGSLGEKVAQVSASVGRVLDAEQQLAVDVLMSTKADGSPAALEAALICARQNLKTFVFECIALTKLVEPESVGLPPVRLGVWSAHLFDTAQESFRNFDELVAGYPHLSRRVVNVSRANGEEEFEFRGGRRLRFRARSKSGGRGLTGDFVILDEAFALQPGHMGALLPTLSTRRRAHVLYGSSAGMEESAVLRSIRDRGRAGGPGAPAYVEWCAPRVDCAFLSCRHAPGTTGCALDREDLWPLANPAAGRRITYEYLRAERMALPPTEFARERLGWWDDPPDDVESFMSAWLACVDERSTATGRPVFAIDVAPGSRSAAIVAATRRPDGLPHLEVVRHDPGVGWVADWCQTAAVHEPTGWVLDPAGPAGALLPELAEVGIEPTTMTARDLGQACEAMTATATAGELRHLGDPILAGAIAGASRRDIGDGLWAWSRRKSGSADICPLVAATEALWLLSTQPADYDVLNSVF